MMLLIPYFNIAIRSIPIPNAKPLYSLAPGDCAVSGAVFDIERGGKCVSVERVWKEYKVR